MKTNQLLIGGLKKLAISIIAGLFGFATANVYMNATQKLAFDVDESIVGETFIDEFDRVFTVSATEDLVAKETSLISLKENYTRDVLKESGMNNFLMAIKDEQFIADACHTQKVVNLELFRPPREPLARSDTINTS